MHTSNIRQYYYFKHRFLRNRGHYTYNNKINSILRANLFKEGNNG